MRSLNIHNQTPLLPQFPLLPPPYQASYHLHHPTLGRPVLSATNALVSLPPRLRVAAPFPAILPLSLVRNVVDVLPLPFNGYRRACRISGLDLIRSLVPSRFFRLNPTTRTKSVIRIAMLPSGLTIEMNGRVSFLGRHCSSILSVVS